MRGWVKVRDKPGYPWKFYLGDEQGLVAAEIKDGKLVESGSILLPFRELQGHIIPMGFVDEAEINRALFPSGPPPEPETQRLFEDLTEEQLEAEREQKRKNKY